ncbi:hypothetical protein SUGI_0185840 [Cryptomeria japonica]|uniref:uncharacterized protein LOC131063023 n=1 Tax=Cryptomeria japonica TaxID=3369 RepID=UPI002408B1BF|nr:uncharacterized protein LOC131063023 [Cryptomeria japonica]GLJ12165.1 hypothetical protein SUGI_0185840 [Cryptomeria japonica]
MDSDTRSFLDALLCGVNSSLCRSVLHKALSSKHQDQDAKCSWVRKIMAEFGWVDMATVFWSPLHSADRDGRKKFSLQLPSSLHSVGDLIFLVSITMPWPAPSALQHLPFIEYVRKQTMEGLAAYNTAYAVRPLKGEEEEEKRRKGTDNLTTAEVEIGSEAVADDIEAEFSEEGEEEGENEQAFIMEIEDDDDSDSDGNNDSDDDNIEDESEQDEEEMPPRPSTPTPRDSCPRNCSPPPWKCTNPLSNPRPSKMQCISKQ